MAYGIGSILGDIDQKADAYRNNPDALAQSYQQNQQLIDLLVLQKLKTDKEAAQRDMQAKMQTPAATIKDQREEQVMGMTRNEVTQQVTPGLQALGQQMQAAQAQPQAQGISSVPAPNMQQIGMKGGGIIAFQEGGTPASRAKDAARAANIAYHATMQNKTDLTSKINDLYGAAGGSLGAYVEQTDKERENAKAIMDQLPGMSIVEMQSLLGNLNAIKGDPRLEETQDTTANLQEILSGTNIDRTVTPTKAAPATMVPRELSNAEEERIAANVNTEFTPTERGIPSALPTKEAVLEVPTEAVKRAPSAAQQSYTQQLADLRVEQESKLESLIAFLKGAGGQSSFAATMMGGSEGMDARDAQVKGEIMDVLGKLEAIDLKEQEFGIDTERNDIARDANEIDAEVAREQIEATRGTAEANRLLDAELLREQMKLTSDTAKMQDATRRAEIEADKQAALNTASAKLDADNRLSNANKIDIIKMINEKWADPNTEGLVLAALNAGRKADGKNALTLKDVYKPEYVGPFNATREALINRDVSEMAESIVGGGGASGASGGASTGFTYLGTE